MEWGSELKPRSGHSGWGGMDKILKSARRGNLAEVKEAINACPELLNAMSGGHNRSFVWEAARGGRIDLMHYLLEMGAPTNLSLIHI